MKAYRWPQPGIGTLLVVMGLVALLLGAPAGAAGVQISKLEFHNDMRRLWEDHITWTRGYIISVAAGLPDQKTTAARLLRNQSDIGDAVKPFYGTAMGDQLTALLKEHIAGAVTLLDAARAGDAVKVSAARGKWNANGNDIAQFLNRANPKFWPLPDLQRTMKKHLDTTWEEALARLRADYAADSLAYNKVHHHILLMADMLSNGIIKQFPDRFAAAGNEQFALRSALRMQWEDHVQYTRYFIISAAGDLPDQNAAIEHLLQNQTELGNAIKPYYGNAAGDKLTALLKEPVLTAAAVLAAAKAHDMTKLIDANRRWYDNADKIAAYLNSLNPHHWPLRQLKSLWHDHLKLTTSQALARLQADWPTDVSAYDKVHLQILSLADLMSDGIMKQFPQKFAEADASAKSAVTTLDSLAPDSEPDDVTYAWDHVTPITSTSADGSKLITYAVHAYEQRYHPATVRVEPGAQVQLLLLNDDTEAHNLTINLPSGALSMVHNVAPGDAGFLIFTVPATGGQYEFHCPVDSHQQNGMTGLLLVGK